MNAIYSSLDSYIRFAFKWFVRSHCIFRYYFSVLTESCIEIDCIIDFLNFGLTVSANF